MSKQSMFEKIYAYERGFSKFTYFKMIEDSK